MSNKARKTQLFVFTVSLCAAFNFAVQASQKVVLQLRWDHQFQFAGYYAAQWLGYYEAAGLDVEVRSGIVGGNTVLDPLDEVARGRAHFGIGAADIILARDRGLPLKVVASVFQQSPVAIFSRQAAGVSSPADLLGLRVYRNINDFPDLELHAVLKAEGIDISRLTGVIGHIRRRPFNLLKGGSIDAYAGYVLTAVWRARNEGLAISLLKPSSYGVDFYGDSIFATDRLIEEQPELVKKFLDASMQGWHFALTNQDQVADRITRELPRSFAIEDLQGFNRFQAKQVADLTLHRVIQLGHINPGRWQRMHQAMADAGMLTSEFDAQALIHDPARVEAGQRRQWLTLVSGAGILLLLVVIGTVFWNRTLRLRVDRATAALRHSRDSLERRVEERTSELGRRVKELTGLYRISQILGREDLSVNESLQAVVQVLPAAWDSPTLVCARITLEGDTFATADFRETEWRQASAIVVNQQRVGEVEVFCFDDQPLPGTVSLHPEHRDLIDDIAARIGELIEHRRAEADLRRNEASLRAAQSIASLGSWSFNNSTGIAVWSDEHYRIFGYKPGEFEPNAKRFVNSLHHDDRERVVDEVRKAFANKQALDTECRIVRPSGEERIVHFLGSLVDEEGDVMAGTVLDITDRRTMELKYAAAQKMEALGQMTGGVAHEFNNLFMAVSGNLELIRGHVRPDSDGEKRIDALLDIVYRGGELTQSMLSYVGQQLLTRSVVDIREATAQAVNMLQPALGEGIDLVFDGGIDERMAIADISKLQSAIVNLVTNARDAMPDGGTISVQLRDAWLDADFGGARTGEVAPGQYIQIAVVDQGVGMSREVRARALDPFFTTKEVGQGTGLGLSMVYGFVSQLGGYIDIQSQLGLGTTVSLYLPSAGGVAGTGRGRRTDATVRPLNQPEIVALVVEDEPVVLDVINGFLEQEGFSVHQAKDGDKAKLVAGEVGPVDLLVTDIVMPGQTNGADLAGWITEHNPSAQIILMTGYTDEAIEKMGIALPNLHVLRKPFQRNDLIRTVRHVMPLFSAAESNTG